MAIRMRKVKLAQRVVPGDDDLEYRVVQLENRTTPKVGEHLNEKQVQRLIMDTHTTVTIVAEK